MKVLLLLGVLISLLSGCRTDPFAADPEEYENDLTEEAFRFLFDRFPYDSETIAYCIFWGYKVSPVPNRFLNRFKDIKQDVVSYSDVKAEVLETSITFRLKNSSLGAALPVAMFQVVHLPSDGSGRKTMEISWAYQNQVKREIVAVSEGIIGQEKFLVIRDITPNASPRSKPSAGSNE